MLNAYVYRIENQETHQFYYGFRSANISAGRTPQEDFWIFYFTSSWRVKDLISKYGKKSFTTEIVFESADVKECYWCEQRLIKDSYSSTNRLNRHYVDPDTFTRVSTGSGVLNPFYGKTHTTENRKKISNRMTGASHPQARSWIITSPKGEIYEITGNFIEFCKNQNLRVDTLMDMALHGFVPKRGKHVGWTCFQI